MVRTGTIVTGGVLPSGTRVRINLVSVIAVDGEGGYRGHPPIAYFRPEDVALDQETTHAVDGQEIRAGKEGNKLPSTQA